MLLQGSSFTLNGSLASRSLPPRVLRTPQECCLHPWPPAPALAGEKQLPNREGVRTGWVLSWPAPFYSRETQAQRGDNRTTGQQGAGQNLGPGLSGPGSFPQVLGPQGGVRPAAQHPGGKEHLTVMLWVPGAACGRGPCFYARQPGGPGGSPRVDHPSQGRLRKRDSSRATLFVPSVSGKLSPSGLRRQISAPRPPPLTAPAPSSSGWRPGGCEPIGLGQSGRGEPAGGGGALQQGTS